jgi:coenzyme F420 biosynthesis associated uncharacterized protein
MLGVGAALLYAAARENAARNGGHADRNDDAARTRDNAASNGDSALNGGSSLARRPSAEAEGRERLIDWEWATRVAIRAAGRTPSLHPGARAQLQAEYEQMLRDIEEPIASYTGNRLSLANTAIEVLDRPGWIRANMVNFRDLLQPVEELYQSTTAQSRFAPPPGLQHATRLMLSSQVGLLVGYLSRRVLGQYDIALLGQEPLSGGKLYFVEPNLRQVQEMLAVPRDELRRWIALHEATHAHEFELHPWLRTHMNASLRRYLRLLIEDMRGRDGEGTLGMIANRFLGNLRRGHNVIQALMTPEQRELMSHLQALMSLAEGYSNHVMNAVGRRLLPNYELIHERVEHRQRQRSQAEVLFLKITGLALKMEQYKLGERFVDHVVRERGVAFVNRAWEEPETLPTEAEIRDPARWIGRMEAVQVG